jgi:hypothetical protein
MVLNFSSISRTGSRRVPGHSVVRRDYPSRGRNGYTLPRVGSSSTTSPTPCVRVPQHITRLVTRLVIDYFASAARPGALARRAARRRLLRVRRASGCLGTSRGSSSTTSTTPHVWLLRHVARLVAWLVVDYFSHVVCLGASARRAARCLLLLLCCAIGCLGSSRGSSSTSRHLCRSTSRRSVAPALAVCRSLRLAARLLVARLYWLNYLYRASGRAIFAARLLVGRSHWLSLCAQSLCLAARLLAARVHRL